MGIAWLDQSDSDAMNHFERNKKTALSIAHFNSGKKDNNI